MSTARILVEPFLILVRCTEDLPLLGRLRGLLVVFFRGRPPERGRAPPDILQNETQANHARAGHPHTMRYDLAR